jgi:hypothetical protein
VDTAGWLQIGQAVVSLPPTVYVGLAVTSHNVLASSWGLFDDVTLRRGPFQATPTPPVP